MSDLHRLKDAELFDEIYKENMKLRAAIERLTRERDEARAEIEQIADVWEVMWRAKHKEARADWLIDDILAYVKDKDATLDAAERKVARLREALKPFAEMLLSYHAPMHDGRSSEVSPLVGELRRARAALDETEIKGE